MLAWLLKWQNMHFRFTMWCINWWSAFGCHTSKYGKRNHLQLVFICKRTQNMNYIFPNTKSTDLNVIELQSVFCWAIEMCSFHIWLKRHCSSSTFHSLSRHTQSYRRHFSARKIVNIALKCHFDDVTKLSKSGKCKWYEVSRRIDMSLIWLEHDDKITFIHVKRNISSV